VPVHLILTYGKLFFTALPLILSGTEIRVHHTPCYKSVVQVNPHALLRLTLLFLCVHVKKENNSNLIND